MKSGTLVEICLWPHLAVKGLMSFQIDFLIYFFCLFVDFFFTNRRDQENDHNQLFTTLQYTTEKNTTRSLSPMFTDYFTVGSAVG